MHDFHEFFAGGGMVRAGLGAGWRCVFANDFDRKKGAVYVKHWGDEALRLVDVRQLTPQAIPGKADLIWGSFPCQDLSLAGNGAGLGGDRSGTFWPFWSLVTGLIGEGRGPKIVALENVCGALTSHGGEDFSAICEALSGAGFRFGAIVVDAALFLPQSRPRLFFVGVRGDTLIPSGMVSAGPVAPWHTAALRAAQSTLPDSVRRGWLWWNSAPPEMRNTIFADVIEDNPTDVRWHTHEETRRLLGMMSDINRLKVDEAGRSGRRRVGCVYKRTRSGEGGRKLQRAEVPFDDIAGCLRTPAGGSSRQTIIVVEGEHVRSRLISGRETARLMGLPEDYALPKNYNEAYHLTGDGVAVPVVGHLAHTLFEPILDLNLAPRATAA